MQGKAINAENDEMRRVSIPELPVSRTPPMPSIRPMTRLFNERIEEEDEDEEQDDEQPAAPVRRVRIMDLPFKELERKSSRQASSHCLYL